MITQPTFYNLQLLTQTVVHGTHTNRIHLGWALVATVFVLTLMNDAAATNIRLFQCGVIPEMTDNTLALQFFCDMQLVWRCVLVCL